MTEEPAASQMETTSRLIRVKVAGFRSLRNVELHLSPATVLIGPNGSGKSNLLLALRMVRLLAFGSLQRFVGESGFATFLLHYGPKRTEHIDIELDFASDGGLHRYVAQLGYAADESLVFLKEQAIFESHKTGRPHIVDLGAGHRETRLNEESGNGDVTAKTVLWKLKSLNFYHFHDTSARSSLRTLSRSDDDRYLRSDGSNLAAYLLSISESEDPSDRAAWLRLNGSLRRIAPFLKSLAPTQRGERGVRLDWEDSTGDVFGPAHLSDGSLRAIALFTALTQSEKRLPFSICIDEPELGLHPAAINLMCAMVRSLSERRQVVLATQSPAVLDHFEPEEVRVAEWVNGETTFTTLDPKQLASWREEYSMSELFDKNVFGGQP